MLSSIISDLRGDDTRGRHSTGMPHARLKTKANHVEESDQDKWDEAYRPGRSMDCTELLKYYIYFYLYHIMILEQYYQQRRQIELHRRSEGDGHQSLRWTLNCWY